MGLKKRADLENKELTFPAIVIYSYGLTGFIFPAGVSILPFVLRTTPFNELLKFALPSFIMKYKNVELILSSLYVMILGYPAVFNVIQLLAVVFIILYEARFMMQPAHQPEVAVNSKSINLLAMRRARKKLKKSKSEGSNARGNDAEMKMPKLCSNKPTTKRKARALLSKIIPSTQLNMQYNLLKQILEKASFGMYADGYSNWIIFSPQVEHIIEHD
ncbi:unnamed protein product [Orchesella dallaii]|uniref:Uncharacterized protein n=1 Tax=Orchesella dallaii TaxID=48710 RepID=A0ABP1Q624_9HEXA